MHKHAGSNTGIRGVQTAASSEPCSLPRPVLLGTCSWRATDPPSEWHRHCYSQPWKADTTCALQGCSARIRSHSTRECGWAPRHHVCVTDEQPGGRGGSVRPRPAAEGTEPPAVHPAPAGGTGGPRRPRREPRSREGEECSVPEVKPSGGKILRRGRDDFGGDLQFQQKSASVPINFLPQPHLGAISQALLSLFMFAT